MHFGIVSPPVPGHIHPFGALGRELISRGHRVTFIQMADVEQKVLAEGLEFLPVGETDHPRGSLPESLGRLGRLKGLAALRFTIDAVRRTTVMLCRDAPDVIRGAGIEILLVDQTEPAGATVAEYLGLPWLTICCALLLNEETCVPPPFTPWTYSARFVAGLRNFAGYRASQFILRPVTESLASYRRKWRLPAYRSSEDSFSKIAQISQQPRGFDFPRRHLPRSFHYAGPFRQDGHRPGDFPWEKLDGRPLIYASLGTLQHSKLDVFRCFAEACAGLRVQLVIGHGGSLHDAVALPGDPVAVAWAPQREVLARCRLALTHAGLNTVLDALTFGVPLVAVPIAFEQPAIASRVEWCGAGRSIRLSRLTPGRLRALIEHVLADESYSRNAELVADSIRLAGGVVRAADIIQDAATVCRSGKLH